MRPGGEGIRQGMEPGIRPPMTGTMKPMEGYK